MKVIILMAGQGKRFQKQSDKNPLYKIPKPFIPVFGKPMVWWAISSIPNLNYNDLIFLALKEHNQQINIKRELSKWYGKGFKLILLPQLTRGNLETAYFARKYVKFYEELLILDADNFYDGSKFYEEIKNKRDYFGMFPVFTPRDKDPKWCFVLHKKNGEILEISEKDPVLMNKGASAMIGAFYYSHAKIFFDLAKKMIKEGDLSGPEGKKEFYVAKTYDRLLEQGKKIKAVMIKEMWGLGTPTDLEYFLSHYSGGNK